jgi:hypothetical protein
MAAPGFLTIFIRPYIVKKGALRSVFLIALFYFVLIIYTTDPNRLFKAEPGITPATLPLKSYTLVKPLDCPRY